MIQIDMEMPEKCGLCPLFHAEHPMYCQGVKADRKKKIVAPYGQPRPDWCLLHEVTADTDTVSRQAVLDAIFSEPLYKPGMKKRDADIVVPAIYEKIKALPPSPTQSRPHGQWIFKPNIYGVAYCSRCDYELHTNDTNFCPHCGADMRQPEDDIPMEYFESGGI